MARLGTVDAEAGPTWSPAASPSTATSPTRSSTTSRSARPALRRLDNIAANPAVCLLVDHYEDDWSRLWWVRFDGLARVLEDGPEHASAIAAPLRQVRAVPRHSPVRHGHRHRRDGSSFLGS